MIFRIIVGLATYMNAGVAEQVVTNRLAWGQLEPCPECVGNVALLEAEHIGKRVWLQAPGREIEGPFLVADCGAAQHKAALQAKGFVADVDWQTAQRWAMRGPLSGVRVYFEPPPRPPTKDSDLVMEMADATYTYPGGRAPPATKGR